MNDHTQTAEPGQSTTSRPEREYLPPSDEIIVRYANHVCREFGQSVDESYYTLEIRQDLADFLKIFARMYAKHLNKNEGEKL